MKGADWLVETQTPGYRTTWKLRRVLHEERTPYQHLQVVETEDFGRALVLDGCIQTTVGDEFIYHEMITHVPLNTHPHPERVLVIGGGDGGTVREVLRHTPVRRVDLVEIDAAVVAACRTFLPKTAHALDDPRVQVQIGDGVGWVRRCFGHYDVVLVDSSDPDGPAGGLFDDSFYQNVHRALRPGGLMVCQALSPFFHQGLIRAICQSLAGVFPIVRPYLAVIPTYPSGLHCFVLASKRHDPLQARNRLTGPTHWYSPQVHRAAFVLPPVVQALVPSAGQGHPVTGVTATEPASGIP